HWIHFFIFPLTHFFVLLSRVLLAFDGGVSLSVSILLLVGLHAFFDRILVFFVFPHVLLIISGLRAVSLRGLQPNGIVSSQGLFVKRGLQPTVSGTVLHEDWKSTDRPSPEGEGSNTDPHGALCQRTDFLSRGSLAGPCAGSRCPVSASGFGTVGHTVVGSWSVRKSDGKVICEHCTATVAALKRQALSLIIPQYVLCKDSTLSAYLHDNLQAHSTTIGNWAVEEEQSGCDVCGAHLIQLKQEAIHLILAREERAKWATPPIAKPLPGSISTKTAQSSPHLSAFSRSQSTPAKPSPGSGSTTFNTVAPNPHLSASSRTQNSPKTHPKRVLKPSSRIDRWVEEQQHLASSISMSSNNGVPIFPYQFSEEFSEGQSETVPVQSSPMTPATFSFLGSPENEPDVEEEGPKVRPLSRGSSPPLHHLLQGHHPKVSTPNPHLPPSSCQQSQRCT
ncbi:unnamed protein product, partial [Coregonus sp. 'balchen']